MSMFDALKASPGKLVEVDENHYFEAMHSSPPHTHGGFWSVGEPVGHTPAGVPVFFHYKKFGDRYFGCLTTTPHARALFSTLATSHHAVAPLKIPL